MERMVYLYHLLECIYSLFLNFKNGFIIYEHVFIFSGTDYNGRSECFVYATMSLWGQIIWFDQWDVMVIKSGRV